MNVTMNGAPGADSAAAKPGASAMNPSALGKDDFLNLLIAQLSNQNPLEPMEGAEFVAQLAQFSSVEQLHNINDGLELLALGQAGMLSSQSVNMVGKTIKFPGGDVNLEEGKGADFEFEIGRPASEVEVVIKDEQGRTVKTMDLGITGPGSHEVSWDGLDDEGDALTPGTYTVEVKATDADGESISTEFYAVGRVTGVQFDQGVPYIMVGDIEVPASDIREIRE